MATQFKIASDAGDPATRQELDLAVGGLKAELAALEARITWRLIGAMAAIAGITIALLECLYTPAG